MSRFTDTTLSLYANFVAQRNLEDEFADFCRAQAGEERDPRGKRRMKYRVDMAGLALMRGNIEVEAETKEEAAAKAVASSGDVLWDYNGMDDETIEVNSVEQLR